MMYIDSIGNGNAWQAVDRDREMNEVKDVIRRRYTLLCLMSLTISQLRLTTKTHFQCPKEGFRQFVEMTSLFQLKALAHSDAALQNHQYG